MMTYAQPDVVHVAATLEVRTAFVDLKCCLRCCASADTVETQDAACNAVHQNVLPFAHDPDRKKQDDMHADRHKYRQADRQAD